MLQHKRPLLALHVVEMPVILPVHPILLTMLIILQLLIVEMVLQFLVRIINGVISMLSAVHGVLLMRSSWRKSVF